MGPITAARRAWRWIFLREGSWRVWADFDQNLESGERGYSDEVFPAFQERLEERRAQSNED
jgi:hypothetical protein